MIYHVIYRAYEPKMNELKQFCASLYGNDDYAQTVTKEKNSAFLFYHGYRETTHLNLGCRAPMMKLHVLIVMSMTKLCQQPTRMETMIIMEMY